MHLVLWNGYTNRLEVFRGAGEEDAARLADTHRETGDKVIYFYAKIVGITLSEEGW